ncbi:hypothetical protein [Christiangramia salexigens]|uniref:DUF5017 domain-containing protein n=1 Tax=Christiangramia salexigens TaxID=1913577 RepID=A0A1L3J6Z5_9FLAO|nr:hypothetical protein [Christiangramia salexigens]APG60915.1 hypothetical protein LPB144_11060 [Christiangramia salexigens]
MKKSFYLLMMLLGLVVVSCTPLDDIHDEIDNELDSKLAVAQADYVLTEDDYDDLDQSFPNFSSLDDAKTLIPILLSDLYPTYGAGSIINVGFDLYNPLRVNSYEVTSSDYAMIDLSVEYFSGNGEIMDFLEAKYPQAKEGEYVKLTYNILAEEIAYTLSDDDFDFIGDELASEYPTPASSAAQYGNFDRRDDRDAYWNNTMILEALGAVISEEFGDVKGQKYNVTYDIYDGSPGTESMTIQFDGNAYIEVGGTAYELTNDDFDAIGVEFATAYPGPASNAAQYNSFDVRSTSDNYWSDDMLLEAFNFILKQEFSAAADGDKFILTYDIYSGTPGTAVVNLIKDGDDYVIDTEASVSTIQESKVYAYTNDDWDEPYMLPENSYTEEFGQRYSNFDDEEEALMKIGIFLGREFPYAQEGEYKAVGYKFYDGEGTDTEYVNYVFKNGKWMAIPSVTSETLQFGYENGVWVPDNTIKYKLVKADYGIIADALSGMTGFETQIASMERYSNFDRRPGASAYWSDEMIFTAMTAFLNEIVPGAAEGQKYVLTFDIYNGSNTTEEIKLIKENGEWVRF